MDTTNTAQTGTTDTRDVLATLRDRLQARGIQATGPFPGSPSPEWDYLELPDGRHVHVQRDGYGYWQALLYEGRDIVRMADTDAGDWPGDPVAVRECEP